MISNKEVSMAYYTPAGLFSPLDARQKIYIQDNEKVSAELFNNIKSLYPHLRVHVHKKLTAGKEECIGVYEIDEVEATSNAFGKITSVKVKTFHQVYSTAYGSEEEYLDKEDNTDKDLTYNEKYKDIIFYTNNKKVYLNGEVYGGGESSGLEESVEKLEGILGTSIKTLSIDSTNKQLKATSSDNKNFFVAMTELFKPADPSIEKTDYDVVTGNADVNITNNQTNATLKYSTNDTSWINVSNGKVSLPSEFDNNKNNSTKTYTLKVKAVLNGMESDVVTKTITITPKVATPEITIARTPNDNNWATQAIITLTPSESKGASSLYSDDSGTTWKSLTEVKDLVTSTSASANKYKVKATKTGYTPSDEASSSAITLNAKKAYYGFSTKDSGLTVTEIESMNSKEATGFATGTSITITGVSEGAYIWLCCTGSVGTVYSDAKKQYPVAFESKGTIGSYNCYRISQGVTAGNHTFYF